MRVFPISNWTELDVWQYIERERLEIPSIYYAHPREVVRRSGLLVPVTPLTPPQARRDPSKTLSVRFRTVGDMTCTCPVESTAATLDRDHRRDGARRASPSAAPRAWTTRPPTRRWSGARRKATSDVRDRVTSRFATSELLRFITAGSVDDGKSTLIGRLLHDSKAILEDQLARGREAHAEARRQERGPLAAHRWPAGGARAGHHHRRRLPLLRHAAAQVHHRRHAGPRAVHPQHGHRRVHRAIWRSSSSTRARAC